jgi:ferredoxin
MQRHSSKTRHISFESDQLPALLGALQGGGYSVVGPTVQDDTIVLDVLASARDLPIGRSCDQEKATYRLRSRPDQAFFGFTLGPHSWKKYLHIPSLRLWEAHRNENGFEISSGREPASKQAFLGVRPCELHAILIQDRVLMSGDYVDPAYEARRENTLIIAVNCTEAGGTCFCASMGTGPKAASGFDLALTEVLQENRHFFVAEIGTDRGEEILRDVPHSDAGDDACSAAADAVARAAGCMGRQLDTAGIRDILVGNPEHPRWDQVAMRCMTCGNCTMVCPTCFCTTVEDATDLTAARAERRRVWDSCFTLDFSYIHGGSVRSSVKARFRQWLTHKFAAWIDQFGQSGCVGCGRCITWCPVGIDVTEEIAAIRSDTGAGKRPHSVKETPRGNA